VANHYLRIVFHSAVQLGRVHKNDAAEIAIPDNKETHENQLYDLPTSANSPTASICFHPPDSLAADEKHTRDT